MAPIIHAHAFLIQDKNLSASDLTSLTASVPAFAVSLAASFACAACDTIVDIEPFDFKIEYTYKGIYKQVYKLLKKFYSSNESKLVLKKTVKKLSSFSKESLYKECLKNVE